MINYQSLNAACWHARKPVAWAEWAHRALAWCASLMESRESRALPREFAVDESPDISNETTFARLPLSMDQVWDLIDQWHVWPSVESPPQLSWLESPAFNRPFANPLRHKLEGDLPTNVIPLPLLHMAQTGPESLWDLVDVTECFAGWGAELGKLLRDAETFVDRHEAALNPWLISRANRLMSELREGLLTENRVSAHVRGRELSQLLARLHREMAPGVTPEPERALACVGA